MKRSSKFMCCGICSLVGGAIMLLIGCLFQVILNPLIVSGANDLAPLQLSTEDLWRGIPGAHDILITRNHFMYNCTNYEDVLFPLFNLSIGYIQR